MIAAKDTPIGDPKVQRRLDLGSKLSVIAGTVLMLLMLVILALSWVTQGSTQSINDSLTIGNCRGYYAAVHFGWIAEMEMADTEADEATLAGDPAAEAELRAEVARYRDEARSSKVKYLDKAEQANEDPDAFLEDCKAEDESG
jgi:hypothetical protein